VVRPHPGVPRAPPRGRLRPLPVCDPRDPGARPASLLEAPDTGAAAETGRRAGVGDRGKSRHQQGAHRDSAAWPPSDPDPESPESARQDQEVPRAGRPRRDASRPPRAAGRLLRVRRRLSERRGEAASGTTRRALSHGLLPAAITVRERISGWSPSRPEDS
jgi:hypothetical protein